ncbi:hypothetical protein ZWY2020_025210 [Hordeum vulgare]|nr:hypothetical protein ZWY2020_025210 [Hordeum vulgare]
MSWHPLCILIGLGFLLMKWTYLKMSNTKISLLSEIHDKEMTWNAKVVVSRMWHYRGGSDNGPIVHTDIVVLDEEGTHMYGQIPPGPTENLKDILEEGKPGIEDYPYCTYILISFSDIPVRGPNTHRFLDVIGRITAVTDILVVHSQYKVEPSDTRTIVLEDQAGNEISLVLWGARAREFDAEEVRTASNAGAVIAIFVGTLPKMYRGVKGLSGSSACRWYIDEDLPEMNAFRARYFLFSWLGPVTAHIPGEQPMVATPVCEPPVEMNVKELLALDPFDNLKKQFMVKVVIQRLGSDHRWWFLSCRECHKTAYVSGRQYRCLDYTCPSIKADPSYCLCSFGSDGSAEAEFMFFDKATRSVTGKPLMTLIHHKYPGFTNVHDLAQIGDEHSYICIQRKRETKQVGQETETASAEDDKDGLYDQSKTKRCLIPFHPLQSWPAASTSTTFIPKKIITLLMELVELSTTSLAEAMFENLELPKPVYHVRRLEQGGYRSQIEFHRTKECFHASARQIKLSSPVCEDGETSKNRAADLAIEYMETNEQKVIVDYNYYQLEQQKKACATASDRLLEKIEEIKQRNKTIKQITREASDYVEEVRDASNKIHSLVAVALDPAASISVCALKKAILEIHGAVAALQSTTAIACPTLQERGIYSDDNVSDPVYNSPSDEDSNEGYHQDMDDDYAHYMRSP